MKPRRIEPGPGQESVWDYPRPPRLESVTNHVQVLVGGQEVASTHRPIRVLETSHPPVYYIPIQDVRMEYLFAEDSNSVCEWKGDARYYAVRVSDRMSERAAWSYPHPVAAFEAIKDHIAFYAGRADQCLVDGELVRPQPGDFYGGWITSQVVGPFKGVPGSWHW